MDLPVVYHPDYIVPLPMGHRFPMEKFRLLHDLLLQDGVIESSQVQVPPAPSRSWIELVHDPDYVQAYCDGTLDVKAQRRIGLPWTPELVNRTCTAVSGTLLTARLALSHGLAFDVLPVLKHRDSKYHYLDFLFL